MFHSCQTAWGRLTNKYRLDRMDLHNVSTTADQKRCEAMNYFVLALCVLITSNARLLLLATLETTVDGYEPSKAEREKRIISEYA